ncbi:MAG TPA: SDR family oxidoreductase [Chthoniobacteraceae bacterium]|nr:SDR family oxidoreductase [Chthoniobacteraceae bacterium]
MSEDLGFRGKVALVTGSASGIGEAIARRLAAEGASVLVHGHPRQQDAGDTIVDSIRDAGGRAELMLADLEEPASSASLVGRTIEHFGRVDLLVNNAGVCSRANLAGTDAGFFDRIIAINLRAPLLLIRAAMPQFLKQGGGRVLNIGSINAYCGEAALLAYSISKGGLTTMTRNLADAYAAEGVRINQINPGWVLTDNEYQIKVAEGLSANWPNEIPRAHAPAGRIFRPDEIAHFAAMLLSEQAALVNGTVIDVEQFPLIGRNPVKASGF